MRGVKTSLDFQVVVRCEIPIKNAWMHLRSSMSSMVGATVLYVPRHMRGVRHWYCLRIRLVAVPSHEVLGTHCRIQSMLLDGTD